MFILVGLLIGFLLYANRLPRLQVTDVVSVASSLVASPILKVCDPSSGYRPSKKLISVCRTVHFRTERVDEYSSNALHSDWRVKDWPSGITMKFDDLGLIEPIMRAVHEKNYTNPTPIQAAAIKIVLKGSDLMASAQTGTGKTAAFTLPILQLLTKNLKVRDKPRVLIITPTRELAAQIYESVNSYGKYLSVRSAVVFGGVKIGPQIRKLRQGVDVLVATPGRLCDLHNQDAVNFADIEILVLDEADRMLDMGFLPDINRIQSYIPQQKQSLLFSATFAKDIRKLAKTMLRNPVQVDVATENTAADTVKQYLYAVDKSQKAKLLSHLITEEGWHQVLVFSRTKHGANRLVKMLAKDSIRALPIHGNKSQSQRTKALNDFKRGKVDILVATDIAARGLDIVQLPYVVNFDLPQVPEDYVHRIGRTGRAGLEGEAISLVSADEIKQLRDIELLIKQNIVRKECEGFEPQHVLPGSRSVAASGHKGKSRKSQENHNTQGESAKKKKYYGKPRSSRSKKRKAAGISQKKVV